MEGDGGTPPPPPTRHFTPDRGTFSAFVIICLVTRRRIIERMAISHNILYQVGGCAGCSRVETRASETAFGRAGKSQEVGINIRTGTHCEQPLTLRALLDLLTLRHALYHAKELSGIYIGATSCNGTTVDAIGDALRNASPRSAGVLWLGACSG